MAPPATDSGGATVEWAQGGTQVQDIAFRGGLIRYDEQSGDAHHVFVPKSRWSWVGIAELETSTVFKAALLEFVGTALFNVFSIGLVTAAVANAGNPPLAIGIGHAFLLTYFILVTAAPSGGHLNPTITIATMCTGMTTPVRAVLYVAAQALGAIVGAAIFRGIVGEDFAEASQLAPCSAGDLSDARLLLAEMVFSFILLFVSYGIAFDERQGQIFGPILAPFFIGTTLGLIMWGTSAMSPGYTGPSMNWARCFGPDVVRGNWQRQHWVWFFGPVLASLIHAALYWAAPPHHKTIDESKAQLTRNLRAGIPSGAGTTTTPPARAHSAQAAGPGVGRSPSQGASLLSHELPPLADDPDTFRVHLRDGADQTRPTASGAAVRGD